MTDAAALAALVRRRPGMAEDDFIAYWRDVHGTLAARIPYSTLYRVHRLRPGSPLMLPLPAGINTQLDAAEFVDGIAELRWETEAELEQWQQDPVLTEFVSEDEQNVFGHCAVYWAFGKNVATVKDDLPGVVIDGRHGLPTLVVLIRRRPGVEMPAFRSTLRSRLIGTLAAQPGVVRLTAHLLDPYVPETWESPNVSHQEGERPYDAWLELSFGRLDDIAPSLRSAEVEFALARVESHVADLHVYREEETYTLRYEKQPTLIGLRGFSVVQSMLAAGAVNQMRADTIRIVAGTEHLADHARPVV